ncbi:MAG TPA: ATP-binding protein [Terriglobia bacterium]|nr:ATP-binding protein [Terriglobia bacterium]
MKIRTQENMKADPNTVEITLASDLRSVEAAEEITHKACEAAGLDAEDQHKVEMAVHESMINAVCHGNKFDDAKRIWFRLQVFPDRLEIRIRDQGEGFDPDSLADPLESENLLRISGRGIFLIRAFMDEFRVQKLPGIGTEVTLLKRIATRNQNLIKED